MGAVRARRVVKQSDERKQELLAAALRVFSERGFAAASMRDIARAAGVTPGLAYHYFDSKQKLFSEVMMWYAQTCAQTGAAALDDPALTFEQKVDRLLASLANEDALPLHALLHTETHRAFHEQLSAQLCVLIEPHAAAAIAAEVRRRGGVPHAPRTLARFISHGFAGLVSDPEPPSAETIACIRSYVLALVDAQLASSASDVPSADGGDTASTSDR